MKSLMVAVLQNNYGAIEQMFVQPRQSLEEKIYSSIVVHIAVGFTAREDIDLVQLFHTMMTSPKLLQVIYLLCKLLCMSITLECILTSYARRYR